MIIVDLNPLQVMKYKHLAEVPMFPANLDILYSKYMEKRKARTGEIGLKYR
jgi:hypothetical protein